jgi:hypothetical protein
MVAYEILSDIEAIESDIALYEETNFDSRVEAIDYLEFNVLDRIAGLLQATHPPEELAPLRQRAERVLRRLEETDDTLFQRLGAGIRAGRYTGLALKALVEAYVGRASGGPQHDAAGYDSLDLFINRLLRIQAVPEETKAREPEMVYYQKTPARIIFELVERAQLTPEDVFYDLGSGLGHVPMLVHLLSGAAARGVEFEPAYCDYARRRAADLSLSRVTFIHADARAADYSAGSVFFMYTPFEGGILQAVLQKLREEARTRKIRLFTYGPCTLEVSRQAWLTPEGRSGARIDKLAMFRSL